MYMFMYSAHVHIDLRGGWDRLSVYIDSSLPPRCIDTVLGILSGPLPAIVLYVMRYVCIRSTPGSRILAEISLVLRLTCERTMRSEGTRTVPEVAGYG
jgi:hypothetical protein